MTAVIYKYGPFTNDNEVGYAGIPVHVGYQDVGFAHAEYKVFIWCILSEDAAGGKAKIVATGEPFDGTYIGTVVMPSGLVWHVIEI